MQKTLAVALLAVLSGCCAPGTSETHATVVDQVKFAEAVRELLNGIDWSAVTAGPSCADPNRTIELKPNWVLVTATTLQGLTSDQLASIGTSAPISLLPITPSASVEQKRVAGLQTDTTLYMDVLRKPTVALADPNRLEEARKLSAAITTAEKAIASSGGPQTACVSLSTIAVTASLDVTTSGTAGIKFGFGPIGLASATGTVAAEGKLALKFEVHYTDTNKPTVAPLGVRARIDIIE